MSTSIAGASRRRRFRRADASIYLKEVHDQDVAPRTLAKFAVIGGGPEMEYVGRTPLYPADALDEWARQRTSRRVKSTSELRALQGAA